MHRHKEEKDKALTDPLLEPDTPRPTSESGLVLGRPLVETALVESMLCVVSITVLVAGVVAGLERVTAVDTMVDD